eukprot:g20.t1
MGACLARLGKLPVLPAPQLQLGGPQDGGDARQDGARRGSRVSGGSSVAASAAELELLRVFRCTQQDLNAARACFQQYALQPSADDSKRAPNTAASIYAGQGRWAAPSSAKALQHFLAETEIRAIDPEGTELRGLFDELDTAARSSGAGTTRLPKQRSQELGPAARAAEAEPGMAGTATPLGTRSPKGRTWSWPRSPGTGSKAAPVRGGADFDIFCQWWFAADARPDANFGKWWWRSRWNTTVLQADAQQHDSQRRLHDSLGALVTPAQFRAGEAVMVQGERGDCMFFVTSGVLDVYVRPEGGGSGSAAASPASKRSPAARSGALAEPGERWVNTIGDGRDAGDFFGERALLAEDNRRTATVRARSDCALLRLSRAGFQRVLLQHPAFVDNIASRHYSTDTAEHQMGAGAGAGAGEGGSRTNSARVEHSLMRALIRVQQDYMREQQLQKQHRLSEGMKQRLAQVLPAEALQVRPAESTTGASNA